MAYDPNSLAMAGYLQIAGDDPDLAAMAGLDANGPMQEIDGLRFRDQQPTKWRETFLGFDEVTIPAGASVDVIQQPQVVFRGERLVIPSDIGGQIQLLDVRVGKNSQLAGVGSSPGRTFDEKGQGVRLKMDTAQISQQIVLRVRNTGGAPVVFTATLIGASLEM
jgi:hypothetical protein